MHPYATDSGERRVVPLALAIVALAVGLIIHGLISALGLVAPWWLDVPTPLALYGLLWWGFDSTAWAWTIWRRLRLVSVPDLRGAWQLEGRSDFDSGTDFSGVATVRQTWTRIGIETETDHSRSHSVTASILLEPFARSRLMYEYFNEPKANSVETLQPHRGTAWLDLDDGALAGDYYGGRGSRNVGKLRLARTMDGPSLTSADD